MRCWLDKPVQPATWPDGVFPVAFTESASQHAHALLVRAYANVGGSVSDFGEWWAALSSDDEYDPALCFPVLDQAGRMRGFAQCWTTNFVKDFVVHPDWQRRGLGRALLVHVFHVFQERGAPAVELKVETGNFSAIQFYQNLGMEKVAA